MLPDQHCLPLSLTTGGCALILLCRTTHQPLDNSMARLMRAATQWAALRLREQQQRAHAAATAPTPLHRRRAAAAAAGVAARPPRAQLRLLRLPVAGGLAPGALLRRAMRAAAVAAVLAVAAPTPEARSTQQQAAVLPSATRPPLLPLLLQATRARRGRWRALALTR